MKAIRVLFDSQRRHFEKGGRFARLAPLFDATETFFFLPGIATVQAPYVRDSIDLKRFMSMVILALMPPLFFGIYNTGYQASMAAGLSLSLFDVTLRGLRIVLPLIIVSYGVGFFWELLFASIRKHPISEGFLVTGLLFPLTLPPSIPLWQAAVGISFGVVIGKEIFGGTGRNIFNPALTGRAFLFFAYPARMSGDAVWVADLATGSGVDAVTGATPLAVAALAQAGESIVETLANTGLPWLTMFLGNYPGSIGGTSALCCLAGAALLIVTGIASWRIIIGGVAGLLATGWLLTLFAGPGAHPWFGLNPLYHLIMGGFAFGIVYMATDPVSGPGMENARWVYGFLIGMLTVLIRVFNPAYPEGIMLAILFMNLFAPLLDHVAVSFRLKKRVPNV
ncbi:NADH:ubiquinone reductase (Na(+)-transporting) subunit B [Desulfosudis oleivorans]|uniref:Na(+)-translocating NADH-quinone reductase subunit B n=1 Tax=Desulfosudis oleivorans (strain DSM 6200 / JCM 39069 / Hxd3) TaxID=96561 RepID=A8ZWA7_DESOH|nr:NADH:ubiquinone reductase (Na(+)-transporting) subunit B [Desulfosudis oleivorans]ABW68341.1 NADH:ubiquinone oxidoreductase, subunit B [Desulfosudis oleivorans Hxd3]